MSTAVEGRVVDSVTCAEIAGRCVCIKPLGHVVAGDPVHACDPDECGGSWSGTYPDESFEIVTLPGVGFL